MSVLNDTWNTLPLVTRLEVIKMDGAGRALVEYGVQVHLSLQDDGKTLKVFYQGHPTVSPEEVLQHMKDGLRAWAEGLKP